MTSATLRPEVLGSALSGKAKVPGEYLCAFPKFFGKRIK
jgi:hypothetical protein